MNISVSHATKYLNKCKTALMFWGGFFVHQQKGKSMSTTLEPESIPDSTTVASQRIRASFAACRLKFTWLGTTKSLSSEQKSQAAETFGAASESISAGKRLFDTKHESYKALTSLKSQITRFWKDNSLAYPELSLIHISEPTRPY